MSGQFNLGAEIAWFIEHRADLEREYSGKYILIRDQQVHCADPDRMNVLSEGQRLFGHDFFLATVGLPRPPLEQIGV